MRPLAPLCVAVLFLTPPALAQVRTDGSMGPARAFGGPTLTLPQAVGQTRGGNVFHSFADFNVPRGGGVTFTGDPSVHNVFARVTGGRPTRINGTLGCDIPGATVYLINPAGVLFGPRAHLNLMGSLAIATADWAVFAGGVRLDARSRAAPPVLTAAPFASFGFANPRPAAITVRGRSISQYAGDLRMEAGRVDIARTTFLDVAHIFGPSGRLDLRAVGADGAVSIVGSQLRVDDAVHVSARTLRLGAFGFLSGGDGTRIEVRRLTIDGGQLSTGTLAVRAHRADLRSASIRSSGAASFEVGAADFGDSTWIAGGAGPVTLTSETLSFRGQSGIGSSAPLTTIDVGGRLEIAATGGVRLLDFTIDPLGRGGIVAGPAEFGGGGPGTLRVTAGSIDIAPAARRGAGGGIYTEASTSAGGALFVRAGATSDPRALATHTRALGAPDRPRGAVDLLVAGRPITYPGLVDVDGSLGAAHELPGGAFVLDAADGRLDGDNLFLSLDALRVSPNQTMRLSGPANVRNVILRVTGGAPATLGGLVNVDIPGASLYLLAPAGVRVGAGAAIDATGSVVLSSASALRFADGRSFQATGRDASTSPGAPTALAFDPARPAAAVRVRQADVAAAGGGLSALVGGDVAVGGTWLHGADTGLLLRAAAPGAAVPLNPLTAPVVDEFGSPIFLARLGRPRIPGRDTGGAVTVGGSLLDTAELRLRGPAVRLGDADLTASGPLRIDARRLTGDRSPLAGAFVRIDADDVRLGGGGIGGSTFNSGPESLVFVRARSTTFEDGAGASHIEFRGGGDVTFRSGAGASGIRIVDGGRLTLEGGANLDPGNSNVSIGVLEINVRDLVVDHASIATVVGLDGGGGPLSLVARDSIRLRNRAVVASTSENPTAPGGNVRLSAGRLLSIDHSTVSANSEADGGNVFAYAPDIRVNAGTITATAAANGGAITLGKGLVSINGSTIDGRAGLGGTFGGPPGASTPVRVTISAGSRLVQSADSAILATQASIPSPVDLTAALTQIPAGLLVTSPALADVCSRRIGVAGSSFLIVGRGAAPADPFGLAPSLDLNPTPPP